MKVYIDVSFLESRFCHQLLKDEQPGLLVACCSRGQSLKINQPGSGVWRNYCRAVFSGIKKARL